MIRRVRYNVTFLFVFNCSWCHEWYNWSDTRKTRHAKLSNLPFIYKDFRCTNLEHSMLGIGEMVYRCYCLLWCFSHEWDFRNYAMLWAKYQFQVTLSLKRGSNLCACLKAVLAMMSFSAELLPSRLTSRYFYFSAHVDIQRKRNSWVT